MKGMIASAIMAATLVAPAKGDIQLGVLAPRGPEVAAAEWSALASYLSAEIGETVALTPLRAADGMEAFYAEAIDLLLGNPVQSALAVEIMGAVPVASLVKTAGSVFAGAIVVRADSGIRTAADLRGRRIGTLGDAAAGGFIFQARHLLAAGVDVRTDLAERVIGKNQDQLVGLVLEGRIDAAFVRSGVVEAMAAAGTLDPALIALVDETTHPGLEHRHSTATYPEWLFVAQAEFDPDLRDRIGTALLALTPDHPAAGAARIVGFTAPGDIAPVVEAMRSLRLPPFD